jgi:predicted nucleotidyltransferase
MDKNQQIIKNELREESLIVLCILYGSAAAGRLTHHSDIDIAIAGNDLLDFEYLADLQVRLSISLGCEVDLVDINRAEGLILPRIIKNGIVLIKKDVTLYADLIRKAIYFDADILPNIRMILKHRAERFADGH